MRHRRRIGGLLLKFPHLAVCVDLHHPEGASLVERHRSCGNRHVRAAASVKFGHRAQVHPIHVIGSEDRDKIWLVRGDQMQVAKNRISRSLVGSATVLGYERAKAAAALPTPSQS